MENPIKDGIPKEYLSGNTWNMPEDNFEPIGKAKVDSLKEIVEEIDEMIDERKRLSGRFVQEAEAMKSKINNFLMESAPRGEDDSEFVRERSELRKKQIDISETQLREQVECWKDIALLKKEFRDRQKELNEKESRAEMLGKILEED